jgi:hypothetical protein
MGYIHHWHPEFESSGTLLFGALILFQEGFFAMSVALLVESPSYHMDACPHFSRCAATFCLRFFSHFWIYGKVKYLQWPLETPTSRI